MMEHALHLLIIRYGYLGLFTALGLGIVGLPVPDETLLTYAGYLVSNGQMRLVAALICAFVGAAAGITISYVVGSRLGLPFLHKYGSRFGIHPSRIERTSRWMEKYGKATLLLGYFIPGFRHLTAYVAGIARMPKREFALFAYSGACIWSTAFVFLGYQLGERWYVIRPYLHRYGSSLVVAFLLAALLWIGLRALIKKKVSS